MNKNRSLIIIEGAQSTGKSTIINQIIRQFPNFGLINEVARNLLKQLKISNQELQNNINNCFETLQYQIMEAQSKTQIQYQKRYSQKKLIVLDRCAISPLVFSLFYFKNSQIHKKIQQSSQFKTRIKIYKDQAIVFLLNPDERIVKIDGVRKQSTFKELKQMTQIYKAILKKYQIKYIQINRLENRLQLIQDHLMQQIHLSDSQWQQQKQPKQRFKLIPDQIKARQYNLIDSQYSQQRRYEENKQILFRREIDTKQYKKQDSQIKTSIELFNRKFERNKNDKFIIIKHISINEKQIVFSFMKKPKNRLMAIIPPENLKKFLFVKIDSLYLDKKYLKKFLSSSIQINGEKYNFLGFSKSNLKDYGCYFYKQSSQENIKLLNSFGNFDQIFSVSKKVSKLSLLYSSSNIVFSLQNHQIKSIKDVEKNNMCFSDGCGFISRPLARKIKKQIGHLEYLPTAFQIRIKGIKGIVLLNPQYQDQQSIIARQSMIKFNAKQDKLNELIIIDYSKPSRFAAINQQIIMLLSGLGINSQYLLQLQRNYLQKLKEAMIDPLKAIQLLTFLGRQDICQQIIQIQDNQEKLFIVKSLISEEIYRNIRSKDLKSKLKIPLENARLLFGAVYPQLQIQGKKKLALKENQIFLRVTTNKGIVKTIVGTVIVAKNPCYYVGDVRILQAVDISKQYPFANKLVDVIIFSTEGDIPICTKISGSDYDGDHYFVCWDQKLIPKKIIKPYEYPKTLPKSKNNKVTQMNLIDYFIYFDRTIVGRINNRYVDFASISQKGVLCKQCVQLGTQLFSRAIDSVSTGQKVILPDHLRYVNPQQYLQEHIWIKMSTIYQNFFEEHFKFDDALISSWDFTYEMMLNVVQTYVSSRNYNDYQLFKIIKSWTLSKKSKKYDLFKYVDFSQLSKQQKRQAIQMQHFPIQYFGNPFDSSAIFSNIIFSKNGINFHTYEQTPKKWRRFYKSQNQINFQYLKQALDKFRDVLIGIKVNKQVDLVFCITNMKKFSYIENEIGQECIKSIYSTKNQLKKIMDLGKFYKLYYSDQIFQIYQKERSNSFFWFKENQVSIDLTRFDRNMLARHPRINKEQIIQVQIFVGLSENYKISQILTLIVGNSGKNLKEESLEKPIARKEQKIPEKKRQRYVQKNEQVQSKKYVQKKESEKKKKYVQKKK